MAADSTLDQLRQEIDRIDDELHDLIMHRAEVVEQIGTLKEGVALLRPGREAEIIRRLVSRHHGHFPKVALMSIWRELIGGMCSVQGAVSIAVYMPERGAGYMDLARDQFGIVPQMTAFSSPGQVVRAVADGSATVGLMPMPEREDSEPWWITLMGDTPNLPRIIARLPFTGPSLTRGDGIEALIIARQLPEPTSNDRSWLALETKPDISRGRLRSVLDAVGLESSIQASTQRSEESWLHLVEVSGFLTPTDHRLTRLTEQRDPVRHCVLLGGYPVPFTAEGLVN